MGYEEEQSRLAWSPRTRRDLDALIQEIGPDVLDGTGALAVRCDFGRLNVGMPPVTLQSGPVDGDARAALDTGVVASQGDVMTVAEHGQLEVMQLPLDSGQGVLGSMALALPHGASAVPGAKAAARAFARMVARHAQQVSDTVALELELVEMNQRLNQLSKNAEKDPLTEVKNKAAFERIARSRLKKHSKAAAFLAFDLDSFKQVNDIYGHQFGDIYLKTVADTLRKSFPNSSIIGRTGGDEFCVITNIPESGRVYLNGLLAQTRAAIQRNVAFLGKPELGRLSIGVSLFPRQSTDYDELFGFADTALYASKRAGRNVTTVFHPSLNLFGPFNVRHKMQSPQEYLDQIVPHMQPIVDLKTGACTGFEVLARWRTEEGVFYKPFHFDWMFRDHRMAKRLTRHIIEHAFEAFCAGRKDQADEMPDIWINVTAFDLLDPEFVFDLQTMLTAYGVRWSDLVIEVSEETSLGESSGQLYRTLSEIRRRGARVALDDFGTGHAGLQHVSDWPIDIVKIDKSFLSRATESEHGDAVIAALLQIADRLGQTVVVEGIETAQQLALIQRLGCDLGQGFIFAPAMPLAEPDDRMCWFDLDHLKGGTLRAV